MTSKTIKLKVLHSGQQKVWDNRRRFNIVTCGRRFGKTTYSESRVMKVICLFRKYTDFEDYPVGWFAPNYKYLIETFHRIKNEFAPIIKSSNLSEKKIIFKNGAVIDFWNMEVGDAGNGRKYRLVIIDEAGLSKNLLFQWDENISPTLMDYVGKAWIVGTPKGKNDYFKLAERNKNNEDWGIHRGSSYDNPLIPKSEIDRMVKALPKHVAEQEIFARFIDTVGASFVINRNKLERCFIDKKSLGHKVIGVDIASDDGSDVNAIAYTDGNYLEDVREVFEIDNLINIIKDSSKDDFKKLFFDATGVGANFKTNLKGVKKLIKPFFFGGEVVNKKKKFVDGITNEELFSNRASQIWWGLRGAIDNTCRFLDGEDIRINDCIFFNPDIENKIKLIEELTQATYDTNDKGKIRIDKAPGKAKSPNMADAVIISLAEKFNRGVVANV